MMSQQDVDCFLKGEVGERAGAASSSDHAVYAVHHEPARRSADSAWSGEEAFDAPIRIRELWPLHDALTDPMRART